MRSQKLGKLRIALRNLLDHRLYQGRIPGDEIPNCTELRVPAQGI